MRRDPGLKEDVKNLSLVTASACAATLLTVGFLFAEPEPLPVAPVRHEVRIVTVPAPADPAPVVEIEAPPPLHEPVVEPEPLEPVVGSNRLYGTVRTVRGGEYTGFIRWDKNEGSWADLLDATKPARRGDRISGIRFGHVDRMEVLTDHAALFTLKSGERVELRGRATDLGDGMRALGVDELVGRTHEFEWEDLDEIEFRSAPEDALPNEGRLYGTLTTHRGLQFTGYITWDVDEIYTTDELDGDLDGDRVQIPFGEVESVGRYSSRAALVVLRSGEEMILRGTNDVSRSIRGISVSDPELGQVLLDWSEFDNVRFHEAESESAYGHYSGGERLHGIVLTEGGEELTGRVVWDDDEGESWEMLNGSAHGVEFQIEFGKISIIERTSRGARVTLVDGRAFDLSDSNDVDRGNGGVEVVGEDGRRHHVSWRDFRELRLTR